nr:hypothetical protein TR92_18365 [Brucella anthropi]
MTIIVAQQDGKAAHPFDQRRYIGLAELLAKLDQITLPVAKLLTSGDHVRAVQDAQFRREAASMVAPGMTWTPPGTMFRQIFPKPFFSTVDGINKLIDRFVTDRDGMALQLHSPGYLLR